MADLAVWLEAAQVVLYVALGILAVRGWWVARGEAAGWLAVTFGALAAVVVIGELIPEGSRSTVAALANKLVIVVVVFFPYFLYRFMASFTPPARWLNWAALALTGASVVWGLLLPPGEPEGAVARGFIYLVLFQWSFLSLVVCIRLWRGGSGQPTLTRRRMRMLSLGALGLAVAIVLAGGAAPEDHPVAQYLVHLFALASGVLFLIGFAPPALLRRAWRRPEELRLGDAELGLMEAESSSDVAATLLPHVTSVVGGRGSVLLDGSGRPVSWHGVDADAARALGERTARGEAGDPPDTALAVELRAGWLVTQASVYTPFFGRDETEMMHRLAVLADLALERADLLQQERRARAQLTEAQRIARIGSWEWEVDTGEVVWSDGMYAIHGVDPGEFEPVPGAVQDFVHPDDRHGLARAIEEALAQRRPFTYEYRLVGDESKVVQARGQAVGQGEGGARMIGTVQDISERKRDEARRERFIANAAHELRTPLTTLLGFTDLLSRSRHLLPEDRVQTAFEAVDRAGKRLSVLVNNLLDLTKLQQGGIDVSSEPVAVGPLTERVLATTPAPNGARVDVRVDGDVVALADASRLDQIISNLLTNAFRYGGPEIVLEAEAGNGVVVVSVSDNGPGVEEELVPHLFDPFARGSSSAGVGGSGLGLAIVRTLAEAQRGEVWYERGEPTGARFCVRLPGAP